MEKTLKQPRNAGIDLLRIISMLLIVMLHIFNRGGVVSKLNVGGTLHTVTYPIRLLCMSATNIYALISGYVMLNGRFRPARLMELWLQVFVLSVGSCVVSSIVSPGSIETEFWIRSFFPVTQKAFWYFSAYVCVFLLSPLLNRGIRVLTQKQAKVMLAAVWGLFSIGAAAGYLYQGDPFAIGSGTSALWLIALYVMGACAKQSGFPESAARWKLLAGVLGGILFSWAIYALTRVIPRPEGAVDPQKVLMNFINPLLVVTDVCLLALFAGIKTGKTFSKLIFAVSPLTFGVYILHVHHAVWAPMENAFTFIAKLSTPLAVLAIIGCALGIFTACALVDELRLLLFRLCRVRKLCDRAEQGLRNLLFHSKEER